MLTYKDHDYSPTCECCIADSELAFDPTGTAMLRENYGKRLDMAWRQFGAAVHTLVVKHDVLGLGADAVTSAMMIARQGLDPGARLSGFDNAIGSLFSRLVLSSLPVQGKRFVERAYRKGARFALSEAGVAKKTSPRAAYTQGTALKRAGIELSGIGAAVGQQISRQAARAMASGDSPLVLMTKVQGIIAKVGVPRSRLMAEDIIVSTFTLASLDTYETLGIDELGIRPEHIEPKRIEDAKRKTKRKANRKGAGSRSSRSRAPSRSTIYRIRKQELELAKQLGSKVFVRTAGDDRVCPICEDISEGGPYTINRARSLIPAHPRCRCVFIPAKDKRFKRDAGVIRLGPGTLYSVDEHGKEHPVGTVSHFTMTPEVQEQ